MYFYVYISNLEDINFLKIPLSLFQSALHIVVFFFVLWLLDVLNTGGSIADVFGVGAWWKSCKVSPDDLEESVTVDEDEDVMEEGRRARHWDMSDKAKVGRMRGDSSVSSDQCI